MKKNIIFSSGLIIFFMPLLFVLTQVAIGLFENPSHLEYFITSQFFFKIYNSILLCFGVAVFSLILSLATSFSFFSIKKLWHRQILFLILFMLFSISPVIYLTALSKLFWFNQLGIYTQALFVLTIKLFPLATMILIFSFSRIDSSSIKTALMMASFRNVLKHIIIPQLYRPLLSAFLIIFMLTFIHEEVPSFLGYRTYAEEFLSRIVVMESIKEISFMTIPFILLGTFVLMILSRNTQDPRMDSYKGATHIFSNFQVAAILVTFILGMLMVYMSFLLFSELLKVEIMVLFLDNLSTLKNSFVLSFTTGIIGTIIGVLLYPFIQHNSSKKTRAVLILSMLLYWLVPSSLSSLGLIELSVHLSQYSTFIGYSLVVFSYLIKVIPIALLLIASFEFLQSSDVFLHLHNINTFSKFKFITLPLDWMKWLMLTVVLTVFALNELSSTVLLIPPGEETIIVKMYNLMHYGDFSSVAFLSLLQMGLILMAILTIGFSLKRQYDYA